ncbi:Lipid-A-disaccharide synthase [Pyrus ussuriensis x Pyrus communis]|uniref:lipid-A-disaccharide synthase n=1 Tax=Pyrus ussuriensis x Pyrus communis TaxID=2448454 RepID=A0A5N5G5I8_9ROSA|nr:Lipid-A-disaccharide synthase [Pyrus ussuriensis x Pyrus communis]
MAEPFRNKKTLLPACSISSENIPGAGFCGLMMTNQGLRSLFPMEDIAVMGLLELLLQLNMIRVKLQETLEAALPFQPHVVMTVDSKGFSLCLLKQLRARYNRQGLNTLVHFHYVAPSFWAWKGGEARLRGLVQFVEHVLCKLPNEEEVCRSNGLAATFVGHPSLEDVWELNSFQVLIHDLVYRRKLHPMNGRWKETAKISEGNMQCLQASSVALCASGTVALEMQLARLPCVVAYSHFLTELIIRYEAKVPIVSLPNVLMDSPIIPEALLQSCTLTNLASLMLDLIHANGLREEQIVAAEKVIRLLCAPARNLDPLAERHQGGWFPRNTPSKIAATAVLHHAKPWLSSVGCHYYTNV